MGIRRHGSRGRRRAALTATPPAVLAVIVGAALLAGCGASSGAGAAGGPAPSPAASGAHPSPTSPAPVAASPVARGLVVFDGCSLVYDSGLPEADMMPDQVVRLLPPGLAGVNLGVPGQSTQMMAADAAQEVDPLAARAHGPAVLVVWEGTNDLSYGTDPPYDAPQAYRHLAAYCRARQKAGYEVVLLTVLPREGSAAFSAARNALNARLRDGWPRFADALADVAADPAIGPSGTEFDERYYRDTVHLTATGYGIVAEHVARAVKSLL
jgi:lysophospholipase L1-like esterase